MIVKREFQYSYRIIAVGIHFNWKYEQRGITAILQWTLNKVGFLLTVLVKCVNFSKKGKNQILKYIDTQKKKPHQFGCFSRLSRPILESCV